MASVGIIANPAAGKDIRRLVALGTVFGNLQKVNIVQRVLVGLKAMGVEQAYIMPDTFGIGWQAVDGLKRASTREGGMLQEVSILDMRVDNDARDSQRAADIMRQLGVGCIVTLGGDGTNRVVAKTCGETPILPLSTGTNNVLPYMIEGTVAGLAAGFVALNPAVLAQIAYRSKRLEVVVNGQATDMALVDVTVLRGAFVGARAIWDPSTLKQVIVTRGGPEGIGMSALAGFLRPLDPRDGEGLSFRIGEGAELHVTIPLAPGVIVTLGIDEVKELTIDEGVPIEGVPCILALDGEREIPLYSRDRAEVYLRRDGPWIVDVAQALRHAVREKAFIVSEVSEV